MPTLRTQVDQADSGEAGGVSEMQRQALGPGTGGERGGSMNHVPEKWVGPYQGYLYEMAETGEVVRRTRIEAKA